MAKGNFMYLHFINAQGKYCGCGVKLFKTNSEFIKHSRYFVKPKGNSDSFDYLSLELSCVNMGRHHIHGRSKTLIN